MIKTKAIIFDAFDVLLENGIKISAQKLATEMGLSDASEFIAKMPYWRKNWQKLWLGLITEKEMKDKIGKEIGAKNAKRFFQGFNKYSKAYPKMIKLLKNLKARGNYKLGLLTNVPLIKYEIIKRELPMELFDAVVASYKVKVMKPNLKMYQTMMDELGVNAEECLLVDDSSENITGAKKLGMQTIHFINDKSLKKELKARNLL